MGGASARFWESPDEKSVDLTKDSKFAIIWRIIAYDIKSDSITKARKPDSVSDLRAFRHFKEVFKCSILQKSFGR